MEKEKCHEFREIPRVTFFSELNQLIYLWRDNLNRCGNVEKWRCGDMESWRYIRRLAFQRQLRTTDVGSPKPLELGPYTLPLTLH